MSPELIAQIVFELSELRRLLHESAPLLCKVQTIEPDLIETIAMGGILQSFYNGLENLLKRICKELYGQLPVGDKWNSDLLNLAALGCGEHGFISSDLQNRLREYQAFRHCYRHAYSYRLDWNKMKPLAFGMARTLDEVEVEVLKAK